MEATKEVDFEYSYKNFDGKQLNLSYKIILPYYDDYKQLAHRIVDEKMDQMMSFLDGHKELQVHLKKFIDLENQKFYDQRDEALLQKLLNGEIEVDTVIRDAEKVYKEEMLEYAEKNCPTDEEIFAQSFHRLVHSSSLPEILVKEKSYAKVVSSIITEMEAETDTLNKQHQIDMDSKIQQLDISVTTDDINTLLAQQYSSQSFLRKRYESQLEAKKGHQKNEYRDWITGQVSETLISPVSPNALPILGSRSSMFVSQAPSMEESFTIHLGSQLKSQLNIRILSANITELCSPLLNEENMGGLNIALGIYSSSLCGFVVLTPSSSGNVTANQDIVRNANLSTEFHFDQMDDQLERIQEYLNQLHSRDEAKSSKLKPGDVFITKHTNLAQSHIIFHLISDETFHSTEINSRHDVILGLRNILKVASRFDIQMLTLPAFLRHEMTEEMTVNWCLRRAELVFKCAKGFMIESSSWAGAELSTLQLLLPQNISEELFTTISSMVPHIFRISNPKILQEVKK